MLKKEDIKEILKKNPHINIKDIEEHKKLSEELRKMGMQPRGYQLAIPFTRQCVKSESENKIDHRTKNLTSS